MGGKQHNFWTVHGRYLGSSSHMWCSSGITWPSCSDQKTIWCLPQCWTLVPGVLELSWVKLLKAILPLHSFITRCWRTWPEFDRNLTNFWPKWPSIDQVLANLTKFWPISDRLDLTNNQLRSKWNWIGAALALPTKIKHTCHITSGGYANT